MQDTNKYKVYKAITAVGKWLLFAIRFLLILFSGSVDFRIIDHTAR